MINSINSQPYNMTPSVSAVNIQVFNPQAYADNKVETPVQQNLQDYKPITQSLYDKKDDDVEGNYPQNYNNLIEKTPKEKTRVELTDDYIKSLEDCLNNSDPKVRLMAAKDVLDRFSEDETRKEDLKLTSLLNKILEDPTETVRFMGLTALDLGYAKGDDLTVELLNQIQKNSANNEEDSLLASQVLLKMNSNN